MNRFGLNCSPDRESVYDIVQTRPVSREEINADVARFLADGGQVERLGVTDARKFWGSPIPPGGMLPQSKAYAEKRKRRAAR